MSCMCSLSHCLTLTDLVTWTFLHIQHLIVCVGECPFTLQLCSQLRPLKTSFNNAQVRSATSRFQRVSCRRARMRTPTCLVAVTS